MIERWSRSRRNAALVVLGALLLWFAWTIRSVLNPVIVGYLCAFVVHPFVLRVEQLGFSRRVAVNLTFALGILVTAVVVIVIAFQMRALAIEIRTQVTSPAAHAYVESLRDRAEETFSIEIDRSLVDETIQRVKAAYGIDQAGVGEGDAAPTLEGGVAEATDERQAQARANAKRAAGVALSALRVLGRGVQRVIQLVGMFFLVPLYTYYFLFVLKDMHTFVRRYLPKRERSRMSGAAGQVGEVIANFFRGRLGVCFLKGLFLSVGLWIGGVDFAFLLGMLSGALSVIPFFGPFLGFVFAIGVGLATPDTVGLAAGAVPDLDFVRILVVPIVVFGVAELLEGYVLVPKILGDSLGLHPLVVFVALLAGGAAFGMLGILLSLPVTAAAVILVKEFALPALRDFADEDEVASGGV